MQRFVFVFAWIVVPAVASAGAGCVSSATVRTREEASAALDVGRDSPPSESRVAAPPGAPMARAALEAGEEDGSASDCAEIARAVARAHPSVLAARSRAVASLSRSRAEGSLPAPSVYLEVWDLPLGERDGAHGGSTNGMYMGGVMQEIPAARARDRRARAEAEEATASLAEAADAGRALFREVAHACVDWSAAVAIRQSVEGHRGLVAETLEAAVARYGTGGESLARVARTEGELASLERALVEAEAQASVARATLEALALDLVRLPDTPPPLRAHAAAIDAERLAEGAPASRGDVRAAEARARGAEAQAEAARSEARAPRFELRATYMQSPGATPGLGGMVAMSLPWLWGGGRAQFDAAEAETAAARGQLEAASRTARAEVARAAARVAAVQRALEILTTRERPAAERALEAERAGLAAGAFDLVAWIDAAHAVQRAHTDEARLRAELEHALVDLAASVGGSDLPESTEVER